MKVAAEPSWAPGCPHRHSALGVTYLWSQAWVEATRPPDEPWPIVGQQILVATLERGEWPASEVLSLLARCFPELPVEGFRSMVDHMVQQGYLDMDEGLVRVGPKMEREFGRGHYRDLLASFSGAQLLTGRCGSAEVGYIDPTVLTGEEPRRLLLLGGRSWLVKEVEWAKKVVWLEPAKEGGKARWMGGARSLSREVCQGIRAALVGSAPTVAYPSQWAAIKSIASKIGCTGLIQPLSCSVCPAVLASPLWTKSVSAST